MTDPDPPVGGPRPDDSVLDELARAFGAEREEREEGEDEPTARSHDHGWKPASESAMESETEEVGGDTGHADPADETGEPDLAGVATLSSEAGGTGGGGTADAAGGEAPDAGEDTDQSTSTEGPEASHDGGTSDEPPAPPRRREGGMIGEPTVARRTIQVVDDLDDLHDFDDVVDLDDTDDRADPADAGQTGDRRTIAIGGGEDLPDAVYLDDELARDQEAPADTVFIEDEGVDDALAPKEATGPGMEPRLRQRRIGIRRAASRRRLWWILGGAAVVLVVLAALALLGSGLFAIDEVRVSGAVYTDPEILQEVVDDLDGTAVLVADTNAAEDRLEESPWVESARVRTEFPNTAIIEIRERNPLLTMRGADGNFRVLDRDGRVLASIEGQPVAMVLVSGPGTLDTEPGSFAPVGYASAASLVTKLTPTIRSRVDHLLVTSDGSDLRLILTNDPNPPIEVEFGSALGDNEQVEKLVRLERVLDDVGDDPVSVINVSTADVTVL